MTVTTVLALGVLVGCGAEEPAAPTAEPGAAELLVEHDLDERSARDIQETHVFGDLLPTFELARRHIAFHFHVSFRGAHVLAESHDVHI